MHVILSIGVLLSFIAAASAVCEDKRQDCFNMGAYCDLDAYKDWIRENCPKFCGKCGPTIPTQAPPRTRWPTHGPTHGPTGTHPPISGCGKQTYPNARVIAGTTAVRGSWPWQILMLKNGRGSCGGTIVSPSWIVTAAHCVARDTRPGSYKIRVGEHNRNVREGSEEEYSVSRVIAHPSYNSRQLNNDIAMIQLSKPIQFNNYVQPACLPSGEPTVGKECYITGWGKTSHPGSMTSVLQQAALPVVRSDVCERLNKNVIPIPITSAMVCAGHGGSTRKSGCHGDSGGPFVCKNGDHWELHGAVSHGSPKCMASQTYTVFARVNYFKGWIQGNMARYGI